MSHPTYGSEPHGDIRVLHAAQNAYLVECLLIGGLAFLAVAVACVLFFLAVCGMVWLAHREFSRGLALLGLVVCMGIAIWMTRDEPIQQIENFIIARQRLSEACADLDILWPC